MALERGELIQGEIKIVSKDELVLPKRLMPQEVLGVMQRAEKAGIGVFDAYLFSAVTLSKDSNYPGWNIKPENWYWERIAKGDISQDAPKLPGSWVLVDKTVRPDYKDGKQLHENDSLGSLLAKLRKDKKIKEFKGISIPKNSRFGISPEELTQVVLPEIAKTLGIETSQVRLPREIEFNVLGNLFYPEWGKTNTWEWLEDKLKDSHRRLVGGCSDDGGLACVGYFWSVYLNGHTAFRPLVVVSPES